jgi:RNA polymerase sigma-70 factor (ECF subfamily)
MIALLDQQPVTVPAQRALRLTKRSEGSGDIPGVNGVCRNHVAVLEPQIIVTQEHDRWDMARLAGGDEQALDSLMQRHTKGLFRTLDRIVKNRADTTELVQEVFIRVFRHRLNYNYESRFSTWLYTIGVHLAINLLRWRSRRAEFVPLPEAEEEKHTSTNDALVDPAPTPREQAESNEWTDALDEALSKLPEKLRAPLLLFALDGCSQAEVATRLGCSVKAVEARVYHARKRLRSELEKILIPWQFRAEAVDVRHE